MLHGTAIRYAAEKRDLAEPIANCGRWRAARNDILAEAAGVEAGAWHADPATHDGHELIAASMPILASGHGAPLDYHALER